MKYDKSTLKYHGETIGKHGNPRAYFEFTNENGYPVKMHADDIPPTIFYERMQEKIKEFNMPKAYMTDNTMHDKFNLWFYEPRNFIWILRNHGTGLVMWRECKEFATYHLDNTPEAVYFYGSYNPISGYKLDPIPPNKVEYFISKLAKFDDFQV